MLFNSQEFLLVFLPLTLILYFAFAGIETLRIWVLISASLFFYAYWDLRFLPLLIVSVMLNWLCSQLHA
ncbi:MAG: hypothetical protein ABF303_13795, partial [Desulfobacterales bacterium]